MDSALQNTLTIQTPEGIRFRYYLASPVSRLLAWWVDACVMMVLMIAVQWVLSLLVIISPEFYGAVLTLVYFVIVIGYGMVLEGLWRGQTIGKRLLRLRVVDASGLKLRGVQVVIRNLLRFIDAAPLFYTVGGIVSLCNRRVQRLGDLAGGTVVIRYPHVEAPSLEAIGADKYNSFRTVPHLGARLRQRVPQELAFVALQALCRREQLEAPARVELFNHIAEHLKTYASFPAETLVGMTAEHYVRNCVEILFEKTGCCTT